MDPMDYNLKDVLLVTSPTKRTTEKGEKKMYVFGRSVEGILQTRYLIILTVFVIITYNNCIILVGSDDSY